MNATVQEWLVFWAVVAIVAEIGCFIFSMFFCTRCPTRWIRNWRRVAWILWLNVLPIRLGFEVEQGWWQVALIAHLALTALVELWFKWHISRGASGDRCPGPNEYDPRLMRQAYDGD